MLSYSVTRQWVSFSADRVWGKVALLLIGIVCITMSADHAKSEGNAYPTKPVRFVVPFAPGATADTLSRALASGLEEKWKQTVVVENLPGVGGLSGAANVARSPADGYSLVLITSGHAILPAIMKRPPVDPVAALAPISMLAKSPLVFVSSKQSGLNSFSDVVAFGKKSTIDFGTAGIGSKHHVLVIELARLAGIQMQHVPYRGAAQAMKDLLGGHIPAQMASSAFAHPLVTSSQINGLALVAERRHPIMPNVPTLAELGYPLVSPEWYALAAPAGTPSAIIEKISKDVSEVMKSPELKARMPADELLSSTPAELNRFLQEEARVWGGAAKAAGIMIE